MKYCRDFIAYLLGFFVFLLLFPWCIFLLAKYFPFSIFTNMRIKMTISGIFIILGFIFMLFANIQMKRQGKGNPVDAFDFAIGKRTQQLMISGVYRLCRNPMLLGSFLFYLGLAFFFNAWAALIFPCIFILFMSWYVQTFEEPRLLRDFGDQYRNYQKKVPLLFPHLLKK